MIRIDRFSCVLLWVFISVVLISESRKAAGLPTKFTNQRTAMPAPRAAVRQTVIITDIDSARVRIAGDRFIIPGDYVVSEEYGIGLYLGVRVVDITPTRAMRTYEPSVVVKYEDGEISWFQRLVDKELWLYRTADSGEHELSTLVDRKKWKRRKKSVEESSKSMAVNLIRMMAIRNSFHRTPCVPGAGGAYKHFENSFAFNPTTDQLKSFAEIENDMVNNTRPMDRLVCGDVGFGKTEVAMRAIYRAVLSNRQVAFLAPTRVLALQHLRVVRNRMPDVEVQLLRGGGKGDALEVKEMIKSGRCQVAVGTHALLQADVVFNNLGLLVIDEEQRFGVAHKEKLKAASGGTDVLTLSATPIPRTLQMSLTGLRDFSLMNSPPAGRKAVNVTVCRDQDAVLVDAIAFELARDGQVFIVVPFVADVDPTCSRLQQLMPDVSIIDAHGRHDDLEDRIDQFSRREADVLVCTTVIENGIDLPNVNTIVVLSANRFGMSSLYQLRGRVGRSSKQAYAYFMTNVTSLTIEAETRLMFLKTLTALGSGYELSRRDMEMRGYGTIFGTDQSGAKDVGLDLQAAILKDAVDTLKEEQIIAVPDCRIELGLPIETAFVSSLGLLPSSESLNAVAIWEAQLAEIILGKYSADISKSFERNEADAPQEKSKKKKTKGVQKNPYSTENLLRDYLSAGTSAGLIALINRWEKETNEKSNSVRELMKRSLARISSRRLGISEISRAGDEVVFVCTSINSDKWTQLLQHKLVPEEILPHIGFRSTPQKEFSELSGGWAISGIITLKQAFEGGQGNTMPPLVLKLLMPLAKFADKQLDIAVKSCDLDGNTIPVD